MADEDKGADNLLPSEAWMIRKLNSVSKSLTPKQLRCWQMIQIEPVKWISPGNSAVWVVASFGQDVIFFNHIEDGFAHSRYSKYGELAEFNNIDHELSYILEQVIRTFEGELKYSS